MIYNHSLTITDFSIEILVYQSIENSFHNLLKSVYESNLHTLNRTDMYDWKLQV